VPKKSERASKFFGVSDYCVRNACTLVKDKGILAVPEPKKGKSLSSEILSAVKMFYHDEEYSRQLPGKKDFVSISKNVCKQKRLILCNLKELYSTFKSSYPTLQAGFSKFCALRPKWCVVAGTSGTHLVSVCTIHQNF